MQVQNNIPLSSLTTMRLGGQAHEVIAFSSKEELTEAISYAKKQNEPFFVIGGGSNIIARDETYPGVILKSAIAGFEVLSEDDEHTTIKIGAGENWDSLVKRTVDMGLSGIEAMSAIPGTVGATPVQNVGAYGQEIADTFVELEAYDTASDVWVVIPKAECHFSYRNSIFKDPRSRHHIITSITLQLNKSRLQPPFYASLQQYFDQRGVTNYSPATIREAVVAIRATKLPDPAVIANTGSFFKNPIVSKDAAEQLSKNYPNISAFPLTDGQVKLAAGWLIEQTGLKGHSAYGFRTYEHNALVVVNDTATHYEQLATFKNDIIEAVRNKFGVTLEQEPETL